jgi:predicted metal-dependent hydrolase
MMPFTYTVRESAKAKHVSLKISTIGRLEVVIPPGFDRERIPAILEKKQRWIDRVTQQVETQHAALGGDAGDRLPDQIALPAIQETWRVTYRPAGNFAVKATEHPDRRLVLQGAIDNQETCRRVLQRWIAYKAQFHLIPWLEAISREISLPFARVNVRQQKTLWGSCSVNKAISLNCKLLFLPDRLVRYVFVHELCHTVHLNHAPEFWNLVGQHEPHYRQLDADLRDARYCIPLWMER